MAKITFGQILISVLLIVAIVFAYLQYTQFSKANQELIKNFQLEDLNKEFVFEPPKNISKENALNALITAEEEVNEISSENLSNSFFKDSLFQAKIYFVGNEPGRIQSYAYSLDEGTKKKYVLALYDFSLKLQEGDVKTANYKEVFRLTQLISFKKNQALIVMDTFSVFNEKEKQYESKGLNTAEAVALFENAKVSFKEERYSEAAVLMQQADTKLADVLAESQRQKGIIALGKNFIVKYQSQLLVGLAVILISIPIIFKITRKKSAKRKIARLEIELKETTDLIKQAQVDCFKERKISVDTYKILEEKYKQKIAEIERRIPVLQAIAKGEKVKENKEKKNRGGILQVED